MKRVAILVVLIFLVLAIAPQAKAAVCEPTGDNDWCYEWDFTGEDGGFNSRFDYYYQSGEWTDELGWDAIYSCDNPADPGPACIGAWRAHIYKLFSPGTITYASFTFDADGASGNATVSIENVEGTRIAETVAGISSGSNTVTWTGTASAGSRLEAWVSGYYHNTIVSYRVEGVDACPTAICGGEENTFYRPVREEDTLQSFTGVDPDTGALTASRISATPTSTGAIGGEVAVYAALTGTVTSITSNGRDSTLQIVGTDGLTFYTATYSNLSLVYVAIGDVIEGNCIIALAGPQFAAIEYESATPIKQIIFSIVDQDDIVDEWTTYENPTGRTICGSLLADESCLVNNPRLLRNATGWTLEAGVTGERPTASAAGGVTLPGTGSMSQYTVLGTGDYYLTLSVTLLDRMSGILDIWVGDEYIAEQVYTSRKNETITIEVGPFDPTTPDIEPDIYRVKIKNAYVSYSLVINYACLHGGSPETPPESSACYLQNHEFDDGTAGWTGSTGVVINDEIDDALAELLPDQYMKQTISLSGYDGGAAEYSIDVVAQARPYAASPATHTGGLLLEFIGPGPVNYAVTSFDEHEVLPGAKYIIYTFKIEIPAETDVTGDLILTFDDSFGGDAQTIRMTQACLYPSGGIWPGDGGIAGGGGSESGGYDPPPEATTCLPIPAPPGTDVWLWVVWIFESMKFFFTCTLGDILDRIIAGVLSIAWWIGMFGRWLALVISAVLGWMFGLLQWAVFTAVNLVSSVVSALWDALWSIDALQSFFDRFNLVGMVFEALLGFLAGLVTALYNVVRTLATLGDIALTFWGYVLAGINSTEVATTGIPNCALIEVTDSWYPVCGVLEIIEYFFEQFPTFIALVGVLIAGLAYVTGSTCISWLGDTFAEVS